jgi:diguanylate cyclase (GGDEF)-like protein
MADSPITTHDGQVDRAHIVGAGAIIALILVIGVSSLPYGAEQLGVNTGFLPAFGSLTFIGDLITAILLFAQARALRDGTLAHLGASYFFSAAIIVPHLMAFPGVFAAVPLIGSSASAVWLWNFWHGGFALGVVNFAARRQTLSDKPVRVWPFMLVAAGIAVALAVVATVGEPLLPTILVDHSYARINTLGIAPTVLAVAVLGLVLVAVRLRNRSILTLWLMVAMAASVIDIALTMLGSGRFTFGWYMARCLSLIAGFSVLTALLADFVTLFNNAATANRKLERLSLTDPLTEIANRRSFEQRLDVEWRRAFREQVPLSLVMIDIDHFKRYNDHFGHPAGDECLRQVAAALTRRARRPWDMSARLGGEEFAVLMPQTEAPGAATVAESFRAAIHDLALPHPDSGFQIVTISVGVATMYAHTPGHTPKTLVEAADAALYVAKTTGRNQVHQHVDAGQQAMIDGLRQQIPGLR